MPCPLECLDLVAWNGRGRLDVGHLTGTRDGSGPLELMAVRRFATAGARALRRAVRRVGDRRRQAPPQFRRRFE